MPYLDVALPDSDLAVYVGSGAFAIVVFVAAMAALVFWAPVELTVGTAATFTVGFLVFMGVYFAAMAVYRGIDNRDDVR